MHARQGAGLPVSGAPEHAKTSWLARMRAPEPKRAVDTSWRAQKDGSACLKVPHHGTIGTATFAKTDHNFIYEEQFLIKVYDLTIMF